MAYIINGGNFPTRSSLCLSQTKGGRDLSDQDNQSDSSDSELESDSDYSTDSELESDFLTKKPSSTKQTSKTNKLDKKSPAPVNLQRLNVENYPWVRQIDGPLSDELILSYSSILPLTFAYQVVVDFARARNRIFTGGMAIDLALKSKGSFLYDKYNIDFDFLSPDFHRDAFDLTDLLGQDLEKDRLNAIVAMHPSTMRVRYNFQAIADITYTPHELFDLIPTIEANGCRIVHPCYQMIDQHLALSMPYANEPLINLGGRYKKDFIRQLKLMRAFPPAKYVKEVCGKHQLKKTKIDLPALLNQIKELGHSVCFAGDVTLDYYEQLGKKSVVYNLSKLELCAPLVIFSNDFVKLAKSLDPEAKFFNRVLDKIPRTALVNWQSAELILVDNTNRWVTATQIDKHFSIASIHTASVVALSYAMIYKKADHAELYIRLAEIYLKLVENESLWALCASYFGQQKISESRLIAVTKSCEGKTPNSVAQHAVPNDLHAQKSIIAVPNSVASPKNYYPASGKPADREFDPLKSEFYEYDGKECPEPDLELFPSACSGIISEKQFFD